MRTLALRLTLSGALVAALALPAAASADPVRDCSTNGSLTQRYSASQLRSALKSIPADVKEYTDCYDQIRRAELSAAASSGKRSRRASASGSGGAGGDSGSSGSGGGPGGSGSGGSGRAVGRGGAPAASGDAAGPGGGSARPVKVGDQEIAPGTSGLSEGGAEVPAPLVVVLALLGAGGLAFAATRLRARAGRRSA